MNPVCQVSSPCLLYELTTLFIVPTNLMYRVFVCPFRYYQIFKVEPKSIAGSSLSLLNARGLRGSPATPPEYATNDHGSYPGSRSLYRLDSTQWQKYLNQEAERLVGAGDMPGGKLFTQAQSEIEGRGTCVALQGYSFLFRLATQLWYLAFRKVAGTWLRKLLDTIAVQIHGSKQV